MAKSESILAVDIGAESLKLAEFSYPPGGGVVLEKFAFLEYGTDLKEEELVDALGDAFHNALTENDITAKKVHVSVSGQSAFIRFVKLPPVEGDENKIRQLVNMEARQNVPFPMNEVVWDYQLVHNDDDDEIEVMFVVVKSEVIERITDIIEDFHKDVVLVEVAPVSSYNSARANEVGADECVMILNIGGKCSSLVFIDSGRFFVRSIPIAGHSITQQVSKEFSIPFGDAEEMKRRHGFVALGGAYEEPDSEVSATVSKIVRNVMTRLHGEINRSINVYRSQQKGKKPMRLYLAGGSSVMAFTPRFFSEKLRIPVEYFNPFHVVTLGSNIDRETLAEVAHMFSEVIGLGLRKATPCPIEISLLPESVKQKHNIKQKIPYLYASCASLVLCLLVTWFGLSRHAGYEEKRVDMAKKVVTDTQQRLRTVKAAAKELSDIRNRYDVVGDMLEKRGAWPNLLNELQEALPDQTWLVSLKALSAPPAQTAATAPTTTRQRPGAGGGLFLFGTTTPTGQPQTQVGGDIAWIEIGGHSLYFKNELFSYYGIFKKNLDGSPLFSDTSEDIRDLDFQPRRETNNFDSFKMAIKLQKPISR